MTLTKLHKNENAKPETLLIEKSLGKVFGDLDYSPGEAANLSMRSHCMVAIKV